ncbi:hypothetical protein MLD38_036030 [Melastoma candidum]|uniref:Uncharacterized protein n=1 Tax=Melastoma candidum TaxID=119954 RepID=A0ACB9LIM3_9MYRT|nr:hypothetical protein MLD38_036030 [Melastoma candidum]
MEEDGRPRPVPPTESAQLIRPIAFYLTPCLPEPGVARGKPHLPFLEVPGDELLPDAQEGYVLARQPVDESQDHTGHILGLDSAEKIEKPENEERDDFEDACCDRDLSFCYLGRRGYEACQVAMFRVFKFTYENPPPATTIFISADKDFAPVLFQLKEDGYNLITMSRSKEASTAFREAGRFKLSQVIGLPGIFDGRQDTLVLREIPEDGVRRMLANEETLAPCEIAIFVHDSCKSFRKKIESWTAELELSCADDEARASLHGKGLLKLVVEVASHGKRLNEFEVPCLIVAANDDLDPFPMGWLYKTTRVARIWD